MQQAAGSMAAKQGACSICTLPNMTFSCCTLLSEIRLAMLQVFYKFHIICWVMFYVFASIHCKQITYYSSPGNTMLLVAVCNQAKSNLSEHALTCRTR